MHRHASSQYWVGEGENLEAVLLAVMVNHCTYGLVSGPDPSHGCEEGQVYFLVVSWIAIINTNYW